MKALARIIADGIESLANKHICNPEQMPQKTTMNASELIYTERSRQVSEEGCTPEHDDRRTNGEIAHAAACYAIPEENRWKSNNVPVAWPLDPESWKPTPNDRISELVKAGALIQAEIERLQRIEFENTKFTDHQLLQVFNRYRISELCYSPEETDGRNWVLEAYGPICKSPIGVGVDFRAMLKKVAVKTIETDERLEIPCKIKSMPTQEEEARAKIIIDFIDQNKVHLEFYQYPNPAWEKSYMARIGTNQESFRYGCSDESWFHAIDELMRRPIIAPRNS